jgi:hypothetical protein
MTKQPPSVSNTSEQETLERAIKDGKYPLSIPRPKHRPSSRVVPVPTLLITSGIFKYSHKVTDYTIENPMVITTNWGIAYYRGPALTQRSLNVLASALQVAGTHILRGPRKSFNNLRVVGGTNNRNVLLEERQDSSQSLEYEFVDAFYGETVLSRIALCAMGDTDGAALNLTRRELVRLMDGRFYVQVNPKKNSIPLPRWLSIRPEEERIRDDEESELSDYSVNLAELSAGMRLVLGYDPERGADSPLTVHPFFDPTFKNTSRMSGGIGFVFSPFLTHLMTESPKRKPTFLDMEFRCKIPNDGMAQQLHSIICSQTNRSDPIFRIGYDKLMNDLFQYDIVIRKKLKGDEVREYPATAEFVRQINKRLDLLADKGFIKDWHTKPSADLTRKTNIITVERLFYKNVASVNDPENN